jgi:hypothetical protein
MSRTDEAVDDSQNDEELRYCALPAPPERVIPPGLGSDRLGAILQGRTKWVNGTVLHYYFFDRDTDGSRIRFPDGTTRLVSWVGPSRNSTSFGNRSRPGRSSASGWSSGR